MIDDPVTRIVTILFRHAQDLSHQPRVLVPADQPRNLDVRGNTPFRYFLNNRKYLVYQILVYHAAPHGIFHTLDGNRAFFLTPSISTNLRFLSTPTKYPVAYRGLRVATFTTHQQSTRYLLERHDLLQIPGGGNVPYTLTE